MKLHLFSLSTGWQCMEVRLPCALCEMEQSLATSDHTVITPTPHFLLSRPRLHVLVAITFNHSSTQEQVLPSRAADTRTVCLSCRVFVNKRICLKCKLPLFAPQPCLALPAPLSLCGPLGNIVSFLRACSQCSHGRLNRSFIQMNEALFCLENQTQTVHVRARRMSVENRGL